MLEEQAHRFFPPNFSTSLYVTKVNKEYHKRQINFNMFWHVNSKYLGKHFAPCHSLDETLINFFHVLLECLKNEQSLLNVSTNG